MSSKVLAGRPPLTGEMDIVIGDEFTFTLIADSLPDDVSFWWPNRNAGIRVSLPVAKNDDNDSAVFTLDSESVKQFARDYRSGYGSPQLDIGEIATIVFTVVRIHVPDGERATFS